MAGLIQLSGACQQLLSNHGIPMILSVARIHEGRSGIQESVIHILGRVAGVKEAQMDVLANGGIPTVLTIARLHAAKPYIQDKALRFLALVLENNDDMCHQILSSHGINDLLDMAKGGDQDVSMRALRILTTIAEKELQARQHIEGYNGVPVLLEIALYHDESSVIQAIRCLATAMQSSTQKATQDILANNGVNALLTFSQRLLNNTIVQAHVLQTIRYVVQYEQARRQVLDTDWISWLFQMCPQHESDKDVQLEAFRVMKALSRRTDNDHHNETSRKASGQIISHGGVDLLLRESSRYKDHPDVLEQALGALVNILNSSREEIPPISLANDGVQHLMDAAGNNFDNLLVVRPALSVLARGTSFGTEVCRQVRVKFLLDACRQHKQDAAVQREAFRALEHLVSASNNDEYEQAGRDFMLHRGSGVVQDAKKRHTNDMALHQHANVILESCKHIRDGTKGKMKVHAMW